MTDRASAWPLVPPEPTGWLTMAEAAERLDRPAKYLVNRAAQGHVPSVLHERRRWVHEDTVAAILAEREEWISYVVAAAIIGCAPGTVTRLVETGQLVGRHTPRRPSISRASAEELAVHRRAELAQAEVARAARAAEAEQRSKRPPDDGQVWLDTATTGLVLGITANRVRQLSLAGRIPCLERAGRRWYRRVDVEQLAAARAFRAKRAQGA